MRKMKKINGYLVVKFNDRELREWEGTALGKYGVIDAELYTGILDIDRGAMEYDNAGSMEEAVELARGLESELDTEEPEVKVTLVKETDETTEEAVKARQEPEERTTFEHLHPELKRHRETAQIYALGLALSKDCPPNDCRVYLNIFNAARELDAALDGMDADSTPALCLRKALRERVGELAEMFDGNFAVKQYRKEARS